MQSTKTVEGYIEKQPRWKEPLQKFRNILLETELLETTKWGIPVYTLNDKNVLGMSAFKSYVGIWFFQGVFMKDPSNKLINAQEGRTKGLRQWRFQSIEEIEVDLLKAYLHEAIENQKSGKEIKPQKKPLILPAELINVFSSDKTLNMQCPDKTTIVPYELSSCAKLRPLQS